MPKEVKGIIIHPGSTFEHKEFKELSDYKSAVGGLIEAVRLYDYTYENEVATMYVNEEGRILDLPMNAVAGGLSFLLNGEDMLFGNAIVVGAGDGEGYDTDVPEWIVEFIKRVAKEVPNA